MCHFLSRINRKPFKTGLTRLYSRSGNNCLFRLPNSETGDGQADSGPTYTRLIPSFWHIIDNSVTYERLPDSETSGGRRDTSLHNMAHSPKRTGGLCATGSPLPNNTQQ